MQRIRYGYELCPDYVRAGVVNYNKGSIEFENGSRIVVQQQRAILVEVCPAHTVMSLHLLIQG